MEFQKTYSNILIVISAVVTLLSMGFQGSLIFGMHGEFFANHKYGLVVIQFLLYQFLHGGFLHLFSNAIFLYLFGNVIEKHIGKSRYNLFFIGNTLFVGFALLFFSSGPTIGISGFAMAILTYYMLELKKIGHPDYKGAFFMLIINILIGLTGNISFIGHLAGALWGGIFWLGASLFFQKNQKYFG